MIIRQRKHPKQKRDQRVPLLPEAVEIIKRQPHCRRDFHNGRSIGHAFSAPGTPLAGDIRWHDLRHEGVSRLLSAAWTRCGWPSLAATATPNQLRRYTHLSPGKY